MTDATIRAASAAIGLALPPSYAEFLRQFGCGFISYHELIGLGGPSHLDVAEQTRLLRSQPRISRFPFHLIPILADGYGNYECLDTSRNDPTLEVPVVQWLHDGGDDQVLTTLAGSYDNWIRALIVQVRSVEAGDQTD